MIYSEGLNPCKKNLLVEALDGYVDFQILDCRIRPMVPL